MQGCSSYTPHCLGGGGDVDRGILNGDREQHSATEENMAKSVTFISTLTPEWYFMSKPLTSIGARENVDWETTKTVMNLILLQ